MKPRRALLTVASVEVLAMGTWFSATAVQPALQARWDLTDGSASWLTAAVQLGFVAGSLLSATLNLPDRMDSRRLIALSAILAAAANLALLAAGSAGVAVGCRLLTGICLAGVYPPGMKLISTYYRRRRGFAIGVVIAALTLGSGSPYLVRALPDVSWQGVVVVTSIAAVIASLLIRSIPEGPHRGAPTPLDLGFIVRALRDRPLRLATFGYLGHMWELYAFWAWLPAFVAASAAAANDPLNGLAGGLVVFGVIGVSGAIGAVLAGQLGDRFGRTALTSAAMAISGACCVLSLVFYGSPMPVLVLLLVVWGAAVIADSGQFSAAITELAPPRFVGSALTLQTALGFLLTAISIRIVPEIAHWIDWQYSLAVLTFGPALGIAAMLRLRSLPAAARLADGRR